MPDLAWPTRAVWGFVAALLLSAVLSYLWTLIVRRLRVVQQVRSDGPESHLSKTGTPQMGGVGFLAAISGVAAATGLLSIRETLLAVLLMIAFAAIGFVDDYLKFAKHSPYGWHARYRLPVEVVVASVFVGLIQMAQPGPAEPGAFWAYALGVFVVVGGANAVNLTDGLDGLAAGLVAIIGVALAAAAAVLGASPAAIALAAIVAGGAAGFLWVNAPPAQVFMGDVGSMGLGAALCGIAVLMQIEVVFGVLAFIFVIEALSVMAQVASYQATGKRILKMAPFHHHLEKSGWPEQRIVVRAWLLSALVGVGVVGWLLWQTHGSQVIGGGFP
jgi:phospho-N-acetylmuramoyl-pentapeptide-transferase